MFKSFQKVGASDASLEEGSTLDTTTPAWGLPEENIATEPVVSNTFAPISSPVPVSTPSYGGGSRGTRNVLNSDVSVKGTLTFTDDLLVDGIVEGEITSDGCLTIGTKADIQAEIKTSAATIHGKVRGNITVTGEVALMSTAEVIGDITAATLSIQSGAIFIGRSCMPQNGVIETPSSSPAKKNSLKDNDLL